MAESETEPTSTGPDAPNGPEARSSRNKQHWPQGELAVGGFSRLERKFGSHANADEDPFPRPTQETFSNEQLNVKKDLLSKLRSNLLPQLRHHTTTLSRSLDPDRLQQDPGLHLKIILELQSDIDQTLNQVAFTIYAVCPDPESSLTTRINDRHLKEFKFFRTDGLHCRIADEFCPELCSIFSEGKDLIQQMELSTTKYPHATHIASSTESIKYRTWCALFEIDSAIEWLEGSEFDLVRRDWPMEVRGINQYLEFLGEIINRTAHLNEANTMSTPEPLSNQAIQLYKSLLPSMKLSRMFFNKVVNRAMSRKRLPLFTEMRSDQLRSIGELAELVCSDLHDIMDALKTADSFGPAVTHFKCNQITKRLEGRFESALFLILLYFAPLIPDPEGFPVQNDFKAWFATWYTQFTVAIQHFSNAVDSFNPNVA
ncbi:hypothetical protein PTTG_29493 [Puccinia triticina 1-1 BBBD Race 1]|uniref:Uncharacterized protein n=1 Tax=Puccinia triticina (isolate 1-1 / race 1 (BBBD)) TaxID=630390 RepID=A0A180G3S5_PUCT1|nr:hypothetical protein PTTG_29493 [Puccinia triticina 1-1 BBBD Race 1]